MKNIGRIGSTESQFLDGLLDEKKRDVDDINSQEMQCRQLRTIESSECIELTVGSGASCCLFPTRCF